MRRAGAAALLLALSLLGAGCTPAEDEEMQAPPTPTVTVTRTPAPDVPAEVPVGATRLDPAATVWAQGSLLHDGGEPVDVEPRTVEAMVRGWGGVYFLDGARLWFTDFERVRDTGLDGVAGLGATPDGTRLRVVLDLPGARGAVHAYDARTGREVPAGSVRESATVPLRGRATTATVGDTGLRLLAGPGGYAVSATADQPFTVLDREERPVELGGQVPERFAPALFTDTAAVIGTAYAGTAPTTPAAVTRCDLLARTCTEAGTPAPGTPVVFATGR